MSTRRLKLFIAASLDGYIARRDETIDWLFHDADYGYTTFYNGIDTLVMGRHTYDVGLTMDPYPYPGKRVIVLSRTRTGIDQNGATYTDKGPFELVHSLKSEPGSDIWLVGGGETIRAFLAAGLIDDLDLFVHPMLLGDGLPLFPAGFPETVLELASFEPYPSGLVRLSYRRPAANAS